MSSPDATARPTDAAVVAFFDEQLMVGASVERLLERAAVFAGCRLGVVRADGSRLARTENGEPLDAPPPSPALTVPAGSGGHVWVEGADEETNRALRDRLAVAVAVIERWSAPPRDDAPPPIEVLFDPAAGIAARAVALERLRIAPRRLIRVVMCSGPADGVARVVDEVAHLEPVLARTEHDDRTVLVLGAHDDDGLPVPGIPPAVRAAYGRVVEAHQGHLAYRNARDAFRFTLPSARNTGPYPAIMATWVDGARLSGLGALCRLSRAEIEEVSEVHVLESIAQKHGEHVLHVLEAYAATESLRRGAAQVHMHHNSIRYWVAKAEEELGYSLLEPYRRAVLLVSLCLLRLCRDGDFD